MHSAILFYIISMEGQVPTAQDPYIALKEKVTQAGLFKKRPFFYMIYTSLLSLGLVASLYATTLTTNIWLQTLNAIFLGIISMQLGFLGHDIAHHQVFGTERKDRWYGSLVYALGIGISLHYWYGDHNEHHKFTNQIGKDPNIDLPFAFKEEQLAGRSAFFKKYILPHQHWYFFPLITLVYLDYVLEGIPWNVRTLARPIRLYEVLLSGIHFAIMFWIIFSALGLWLGIYFFIVMALTTGTYAGFSFAPNHKGKDILAHDAHMTYIEQIVTTRNITGGPVTDLLMGGLNYQIEHHLFPDLPRPNLAKAQVFAKQFCKEQHIPYHETSFFGSVQEIYQGLKALAQKTSLKTPTA